MEPLNETARDRETTRVDFPDEPERERRHEGPRWPGVLAGGLALVGGAAIDLGLYRPFFTANQSLAFKDLVVWPDWRVRLGLSVAAGLFGLIAALLAGGAAGRTALGGLVLPAILVATINGAIAVPVIDVGIRESQLGEIALGGWLTMGGTAAVLVAALVALGHLGPRASGRSTGAGFLAVVGIGGLLFGWLTGSFAHRGQDPVTAFSYFSTLAGADRNGWTTAVAIAGLAIAVGALGLAAGRVGAAAAGIALGGAVAVGVDAVIRFLMTDTLRDHDVLEVGAPGLDRADARLIAYAATALVLLMLALVLRGRSDIDDDFSPVPDTEPYDSRSFGATGTGYDTPDRPFDQYTSGYGSRDPFQYLPEREGGNTGRYPLVPDDPTHGANSTLRPPRD